MLTEPLEPQDLKRVIRAALTEGELRFTRHAYQEMENDQLVEQDIRNCLRAGRFDGCDFERSTWRYRFRTGVIMAVIAIRSLTKVVVVTAWRERR